MAPKRKTNTKTVCLKNNKRQSQRLISKNFHGTNNPAVISKKKQHRSQRTGKETKRCRKNDNLRNNLEIIDEEDSDENLKSMSIDRNDTDPSQQESSISNSSSNPSDEGVNEKMSTNSRFDVDDDTSEFEAMFMSKVPGLRTKSNHSSTPLVPSQYHNKHATNINAESHSFHEMDNNVTTPLSTITISQSATPNGNINNYTTPSNSRAKSNLSGSSQAFAVNQTLPSINYTDNNIAVLETFPEYRNLKRELRQALNQIECWKTDYNTLHRQMEKLRKNSFPRPTAEGRLFLEQLLESIKFSDEMVDKRSLAQLASDIGVLETVLLSSTNVDPQKAALHVFNHIFPTNEDKESLLNVANIMIKHPNLIENIYAFARRNAGGCNYSIASMKDAFGNSIRCARHKLRVNHANLIGAAAINGYNHNNGYGDI